MKKVEVVRLLDILENQMLSFAAQATAAADVAALLKAALSENEAQGATNTEDENQLLKDVLVAEDEPRRTFGDGRGKRKSSGE